MKKRRLSEKMGGGLKGASYGVNSSGPHFNRYKTKFPTGYHTGGFQGDADSLFSQRLAMRSTIEESDLDYLEDPNILENDETLLEFFARLIKIPLIETIKKEVEEHKCNIDETGHCSVHESGCTQNEHMCDEAMRLMEKEIEEASGTAAVGGVSTKFGLYNSDGTPTSKKQHSDRLKNAKRSFGGE